MINSDNYIEYFNKFCNENFCIDCKYRKVHLSNNKLGNWKCKEKFYDDNLDDIYKNDEMLYQEKQSEELMNRLIVVDKKLNIIMNFLGLKYDENNFVI